MRITNIQCAMIARMLGTHPNKWTEPENELCTTIVNMAGDEAVRYKLRIEYPLGSAARDDTGFDNGRDHPTVPVAASDPL